MSLPKSIALAQCGHFSGLVISFFVGFFVVGVKRFRRPAPRPAALPRRFAGVGPCRHGLGLAALAAKDFANVDWLFAMRAFVVCCHLVG